jgi:hypothetical protein
MTLINEDNSSQIQTPHSECFRQALQVMSCAYSSRNLKFPLGRLQALLLYKTYEQAECDCRRYNILVKDNAVSFCKQSFQPNKHVSSEVFIKHVMTRHLFLVCLSMYPFIVLELTSC